MTPWNRFTVKGKTIAAFLLLLTLFGVFGWVCVHLMGRLGDLTRTLYDHPMVVSNASLRASLGVIKMHRTMKDVTLGETDFERVRAVAAVEAEEKIVLDNLAIVQTNILGAEGLRLADETHDLFVAWAPIREEVIALIEKGRMAEAARTTKGKGARHVENLERLMLDLTAYARTKADGFMAEAERVQNKTVRLTVAIMTMVVVLFGAVLWLLLRGILTPIAALSATMGQIASTGELVPSDLCGNDEISTMAGFFNELLETMEKQIWQRQALNDLSRNLLGAASIQDLTRLAVSTVCRQVGGCVGAFYLRDARDETCSLDGSFAVGDGAAFRDRFGAGEGWVGQVAVEARPLHLHEVEPDDAVATGGTFQRPPREIYVVAISYDQTVLGVLEVGSFEVFDDARVEFLDTAGEVIGRHLFSMQQRDRIDHLLTESRATNEQLKEQSAELDATNTELRNQADELRHQTIELEAQKRQVDESNRMKSEFLSNMSHELRTPLNSILALSQLLVSRGTGRDPEQEAEFLRVIDRNGRHLLSLINDVLDLSKIEAGRMDVNLTRWFAARVVAEAVDTVRPLADQKGLPFDVVVQEETEVVSDRERVRQILVNLLANAIKFTDRGAVTLTVEGAGGSVIFTVEDTGPGIPPKALDHIFDEFRQVDGSATRRHEGTGLGLAICRKLARLLGGEVTASSELGRGSIFILSLPEDASAGAPVEPAPSRPTPAVPPGNRRVLVVEDNEVAALQVRTVLEEEGHTVEVAPGGQAALDAVERQVPDAVVLDLMMPGMDGFAVLERIRSTPETRTLPVLILTAKELEPGERARLSANNVHELVQKGTVDRAELLARLRDLLTPTPVPPCVPSVAEQIRSRLILVVEDNADNRLTLGALLDNLGYPYEVAVDGDEAVEAVVRLRPALVLMDLQLPRRSGLDATRTLRADPCTADVPVVALTAKAMQGDREQALAAGCSAYLTKPVDPEALAATLLKFIG